MFYYHLIFAFGILSNINKKKELLRWPMWCRDGVIIMKKYAFFMNESILTMNILTPLQPTSFDDIHQRWTADRPSHRQRNPEKYEQWEDCRSRTGDITRTLSFCHAFVLSPLTNIVKRAFSSMNRSSKCELPSLVRYISNTFLNNSTRTRYWCQMMGFRDCRLNGFQLCILTSDREVLN